MKHLCLVLAAVMAQGAPGEAAPPNACSGESLSQVLPWPAEPSGVLHLADTGEDD